MEYGFAPLDGGDTAGGKRLPVADSIHLIKDGNFRVTRSEKVGVQGVDRAVAPGAIAYRSPRRNQGLGRDLTAEHPQTLLWRTEASEEVDFEGFEVQDVDELIEGLGHRTILVARPDSPPPVGYS